MNTYAKRITIVCAAAALTLIGFAGAHAASAMHAGPTAVAVANVENIFQGLKERQQIQAKAKEHLADLQKQQKAKQAEVKKLQNDLDVLVPGSEAYNKKEAELEQKAIGYQTWTEYQQKKVAHDQAIEIESLYRKMVSTIKQVAQDNGYQIVLYGDPNPQFHYQNQQQLSAEIRMRQVLWAASNVDITQQVIQRMNNSFQNATSGK